MKKYTTDTKLHNNTHYVINNNGKSIAIYKNDDEVKPRKESEFISALARLMGALLILLLPLCALGQDFASIARESRRVVDARMTFQKDYIEGIKRISVDYGRHHFKTDGLEYSGRKVRREARRQARAARRSKRD